VAQNWFSSRHCKGGFTVMENVWIRSTNRVEEKHVGRGEHNFRDHALYITVSNFRDWFRRIGANLF